MRKASFYLFFLAFGLVASGLFFMMFNHQGDWAFTFSFRGKKLLLLLLVAYSIGVSTLLFQTLTNNPILTPSILGFDSLYLLIQTLLVFMLGGIGFARLGIPEKFAFETSLMLAGSLFLFKLINKENNDLARMILVGVIFGVFFRSINNLLQRMISPEDFAVTQSSSFASFNSANPTLLAIGGIVTLVSAIWIWMQRHQLDVLLLGRDKAIGLGLDYAKFSYRLLICCALLVSVSTALVGPILFLGLLVCAIANALSPVVNHAIRIPMVFLISAITLILGQAIFEHLLGMQGVLSVVIELVGGLIFIYLMLRNSK